MTDQATLVDSLLSGAAWGTGFAIPFFVGITWAILKILSHPSIRSIARAADKLTGKKGIGESIVGGIFDLFKGGGG